MTPPLAQRLRDNAAQLRDYIADGCPRHDDDRMARLLDDAADAVERRPAAGFFRDVIAFHRALTPEHWQEMPGVPHLPIEVVRRRLIHEEVGELHRAMDDGDLPEIADGIADAIYVLIGTALAYGIDLPAVWAEVQAANMAKVGGPVVNGKRLKPEGWRPPDVAGALERQRPLSESYPAEVVAAEVAP